MATPQEEELLMLHLGSSASQPFNLNVSINGTLVPIWSLILELQYQYCL